METISNKGGKSWQLKRRQKQRAERGKQGE